MTNCSIKLPTLLLEKTIDFNILNHMTSLRMRYQLGTMKASKPISTGSKMVSRMYFGQANPSISLRPPALPPESNTFHSLGRACPSVSTARNAVMNYASQFNDFSYLDGKLIFLSGSPETSMAGEIKAGRLSGLVNLHIPSLFKKSQLPSFATNCIEDWDTKVERIINDVSARIFV